MAALKKYLLFFFAILWVVFPTLTYATNSKYYDFGPYYGRDKVLGVSFSNQDNLPTPQIPDGLIPQKATGILPGDFFYPFEKTFENIQLTFTFDPVKKEQLRFEVASERLAEAKTLMDEGKTAAASQALEDYSQALTTLSQNLESLTQKADTVSNELINKVEQTAAAQAVVATNLSLSAPPIQAQAWIQAASTNRELLDTVAQAQGESAIPEDLSKSIQKLKEQGIISEEESNKLYAFKSRSEVRDEINKLASSGQFPYSEVARLDEAVTQNYPEVQKQYLANLQVVELKSYQNLPQPDTKIADELKKWQKNPALTPSNDIKPYLWYNRAQDLAKEVDLTNFSQTQQTEFVKYYPQAASDNQTYSAPSPSPSISPSPSPATDTIQPSPTPTASASPSSTTPPAQPYLTDAVGALPGDPTYIFKQLGEGFSYAFTFDPVQKAKLKIQHAEARLAEAQAISTDPKKASAYESTLKSYQSTMADASKQLSSLKDSKASQETAERLEAQASRHEAVFERGLLPAPSKYSKLIAEIIKTTEDAMDKSADVLDRPALPTSLSLRLGDLEAQGLILPEETQDLVNSSSREEVRSKIRKLIELNTFPLADAKKLDEAQSFKTPSDYNQLVEVRKVEELQGLRATQSELAQTPALKASVFTLDQKAVSLSSSFDPSAIKPEDLGGKEELIKTYEQLSSTSRPINSGQFGAEATSGAQPAPIATPRPQDAVLSTCPEGAVFKQFQGCIWADNGKNINDYEQYKCEGSRQYYSFAIKKCVPYEYTEGFKDDSQPICPLGYTWSWQTQSCQTSRGGITPIPSPSPDPEPIDDKEIEERSKNCPESSSYKKGQGCSWDKDGKPLYETNQYRCSGRGQYYSFEQQKCISAPKAGETYPKDAAPRCKEEGAYWSWSEGKCVLAATTTSENLGDGSVTIIDELKPNFVTYNSPFYFLKQAAERVQTTFAFGPQAKERVTVAQAKERLSEAADALRKNDEESFKKALSNYTNTMQNLVGDVSKEQLSQQAKKEIGEHLNQGSVEHNLILEKLSVWASKEADSAISAANSATILGVDKAADFAGEKAIPDEVKVRIEALPEKMISGEDKKKLLEADSRVEVRLAIGGLVTNGGLTQTDTDFLNEDFMAVDRNAKIKVEELKKLEEITQTTKSKKETLEKIEKNEGIVQKLSEFEKNFAPGEDTPTQIPAEIRPYVKLTRINEITQTIRPDVVRLEDFQNRKDVVLAVATLQEEFRPTRESFQQVQDFRRKNPYGPLPPELARIEALSYSLGVRNQAGPCFLPTPPFPANTPCPAPGAAIPINSYYAPQPASPNGSALYSTVAPSLDKDGKPLVYGTGPKAEKAGICPDGYHWMYDSGGWCMSNGGSYGSYYSYTPTGTGPGYTPYTPYYTAPGAPPATYGYPTADNTPNDGCPYGSDSDGRGNCISNSYPTPSSSYVAPSYYGPAPSYYTTNPPSGTVPGSGPKPISTGQCPTGYHWMSDSGGWCMADGPTYTPGNTTLSGGSRGSTPWCWSASPPLGGWVCPSESSWDSSSCSCKSSAGNSYTGSSNNNNSGGSYQYGCTPGYFWDGSKCQKGSYEGSGWSDTAARSQSWCQPPAGGCGSNSYWDYGSCSCRGSNTYYGSGGGGSSGSSSCSPPAGGCGSGWFDSASCSCKQSSSQGCYNVSASSCPSGWYFDSGLCTCRQNPTGTSSGGSSSGSCPSGSHWMSENGGYCMSDAQRDAASTAGSSGGSSGSGSCSSGYHWMSDNGGWCMQDGSGSTSTSTSTSTSPTSAPTTESAPAPNP